MLSVIRKNQRILFIVIAVLAIPFIFYFSKSDPFKAGGNVAGHIHNQPVSVVDFQRTGRLFNLAQQLGMWDYLQHLTFSATSEQNVQLEFVWNRLVLRHEAERLGIQPTAREIADVIRELRPFRGESGFDANRYNEFVRESLPALGFTERHIEELASDQIVLARLREIVAVGIAVPEAEVRETYGRAYGKLSPAVVRLRTEDFQQQVQISDQDIANMFEAQRATLQTEEKRRIAFVEFGLNEEQQKLQGRERIDVLQQLANRANDFNQALLDGGAQFEQLAQQFDLQVQTTEPFTRSEPAPRFAQHPPLVEAAFRLTPQEPVSDALHAGDAFYVLQLAGTEPPRPLTLEEARPRIEEMLRTQRTRAAMMARATEITRGLREALNAGTPLDAAAQQLNVQLERVPAFALADPDVPPQPTAPDQPPPPPQTADLNVIKSIVAELNAGQVTEFTPTPAGGIVAVLEQRQEPDAAAFEQGRGEWASRLARGRRDIAFYEWLRERRAEAGVPPAQEDHPALPT